MGTLERSTARQVPTIPGTCLGIYEYSSWTVVKAKLDDDIVEFRILYEVYLKQREQSFDVYSSVIQRTRLDRCTGSPRVCTRLLRNFPWDKKLSFLLFAALKLRKPKQQYKNEYLYIYIYIYISLYLSIDNNPNLPLN